MKLDLRRDFDEIYAYIADRVRHFDPAANDGPGEPGPIRLIDLGFEFSEGNWVVLVFDTRPDAEPDGEWTSHIDGNELERPHWREALEAQLEGPITLVLVDGSEAILPQDDEIAIPLGDLLKSVLLKARADGLFAGLPKTADCELGVDHMSGYYGWPTDEDSVQDYRA